MTYLAGGATRLRRPPLIPKAFLLLALGSAAIQTGWGDLLVTQDLGKLVITEQTLRARLARDAKDLAAWVGLSEVLLKQKKIPEALSAVERAKALAPNSPAVFWAEARTLVAERRFAEAEKSYRRAGQLARDATLALETGDFYLVSMRMPVTAVRHYRLAAQLAPQNPSAHEALGAALVAAGDKTGGAAELDAARRLRGDGPDALYTDGLRFTHQGRYDDAIARFTRCLAAAPHAGALIGRGDVLMLKNQPDKALPDYEAAAQIVPRDAGVQVRIGVAHRRLRQAAQAEQAFLKATQLDPRNAQAFNNLAWVAAERNARRENVLQWAKTAVELGPGVPQYLDTLAWIHRSRGEVELALAVLEPACKLPAAHAEMFYHLGILYSAKGQRRPAAVAIEKALALNPQFEGAAEARELLARLR